MGTVVVRVAPTIIVTYIEVVYFQKFKQVHAHEFETDAQVLAEVDVVVKVYYIHYVLGVVLLEELQDLQLNTGLIDVSLLVFHDFDCHVDFLFVVEALESSAEGAFAEERLYFKSVADMVVRDYLVVALLVIVAVVVLHLWTTLHFLSGGCPYKVDLWVA